ncbi:acyltransferase [Devosia sp. YIM 151766]|uniref:acyltransferase family protein n=1 Tax=Devosia sp. YIM 151766 TaxID=3017325 RepID=UPI00255C6A59|nr:acyltransferase [Devosia sp. YIM 151766]WIY53645.1 acyltransferase [Devosia sp. YIM 151766]
MNAKLHTIQYLRAIAATLVLISHALLYPTSEQVLAYGRLGWLGVIVFFVVSGFIMVVVTGQARFEPRKFLRRRVLRVVPLYWVFTLVAAFLALGMPSLFKTTVFDGLQLAQSMFFVPFYNPASHGLHPLYKLGWTLNYEMFFYLSFALLAVVDARRRVWVLTLAYLALAIIGGLFRPESAIPAFYTSYMPLAFVTGAWLGLAQLEGKLETLVPRLAAPLAVLALAGLIEGFAFDRGVVEDEMAFLGLLVFATIVVALAVGFGRLLPRIGLLERLGDASYSIYLVHIFAVGAVAGLALRLLGTDDPWIVGPILVAAIGFGLASGCLLYRLVEEPLMRGLKRLA